MRGTPDIAQLRNLLFGKDYDELLALKAQFDNSERYSASVASVIAEALTLRSQQDDALSVALTPMVEHTLTQSIQNQPKRFADILYPVMGPAIRKSIQQALNEALENINQLLESSLSWRSWKWRFDAWRSGQSYAQIALLRTLVYQVEQVFLIHRETGLLLRHVQADKAISKDPEIVSGMLTAIQDFIKDSFAIASEDTLDTLKLGELTVLVEHGPQAITALVVRGRLPCELRTLLLDTSETIHQQYASQFQAFNGDASLFATTEPLLVNCLKGQRQAPRQRSPWLAYALLAGITAALGWWVYQYQQQQAQLAQQELADKQAQQAALQTLGEQLRQQQTHNAELQASLQTLLDKQQQQATQAATNGQTIASLSRQIDSSVYKFEPNSADVPTNRHVTDLSSTIKALLQAAQQADQTLQIVISGHTDESGTPASNQQLAAKRAANMRNALIGAGVPAAILVASDPQQPGLPVPQKNERSVSYQVGLY